MGGSEGIVGLGGEGPEVHAAQLPRGGDPPWLASQKPAIITDQGCSSDLEQERHDLHMAHMANRDYTITTNNQAKPHASEVGERRGNVP